MYRFSAEYLLKTGIKIFIGCGSPSDEAETLASELVEASLMGLDSHGIMRYTQYIEQRLCDMVKPGTPAAVIEETPNTALVDCGWNYGIAGAAKMPDIHYQGILIVSYQ